MGLQKSWLRRLCGGDIVAVRLPSKQDQHNGHVVLRSSMHSLVHQLVCDKL
eukprot:m.60804 g.60804  ORF g.60804 m.60804 type:complete len:51 (-) comp11838_c0_seq1:1672-1824(-)